jgi:hypothetical protein
MIVRLRREDRRARAERQPDFAVTHVLDRYHSRPIRLISHSRLVGHSHLVSHSRFWQSLPSLAVTPVIQSLIFSVQGLP